MTAVLINDNNESMFVAALSEDIRESSDLLIGAVDEKTDTACGILAVSAVGERMLSIRHIFVEESFRRKGAGLAMLNLLLRFANQNEARSVICPLYYDESRRDVVEFLMTEGFIADRGAASYSYIISLSDLKSLGRSSGSCRPVALGRISESKLEELAQSGIGPEEHLPHLSFVAYNSDDEPSGALLARMDEDTLVIDMLEAFDGAGDMAGSVKNDLLAHLYQVSKHLLQGDTPIHIMVEEEDRRVLLRHIDDEESALQGAFILLSYDCE